MKFEIRLKRKNRLWIGEWVTIVLVQVPYTALFLNADEVTDQIKAKQWIMN